MRKILLLVFVIKNKDDNRIKSFGSNVKKIRMAKGISQRKLAFECDIEISQISRIERGIINTTINTVFILADALDVSPMDFFKFEGS